MARRAPVLVLVVLTSALVAWPSYGADGNPLRRFGRSMRAFANCVFKQLELTPLDPESAPHPQQRRFREALMSPKIFKASSDRITLTDPDTGARVSAMIDFISTASIPPRVRVFIIGSRREPFWLSREQLADARFMSNDVSSPPNAPKVPTRPPSPVKAHQELLGGTQGRVSLQLSGGEVAGVNDIGDNGKRSNDDSCFVQELENGVITLGAFDGVGGTGSGNVASSFVANSIAMRTAEGYEAQASFEAAPKNLAQFFRQTNQGGREMGTTAVTAEIKGDTATFVHAGDSRAIVIRGGRVIFETEDHNLAQVLYASGEITADQRRVHQQRNIVTSSVQLADGKASPHFHLGLGIVQLQAGDLVVLGSDGLWEHMTSAQVAARVNPSASLPDQVSALRTEITDRVRNHGEKDDNVSFLIYRYDRPAVLSNGALTR